jgi:hypothetical protein
VVPAEDAPPLRQLKRGTLPHPYLYSIRFEWQGSTTTL